MKLQELSNLCDDVSWDRYPARWWSISGNKRRGNRDEKIAPYIKRIQKRFPEFATHDHALMRDYLTAYHNSPWYKRLWQRLREPVKSIETLYFSKEILNKLTHGSNENLVASLTDAKKKLSWFSRLYYPVREALNSPELFLEKQKKHAEIASEIKAERAEARRKLSITASASSNPVQPIAVKTPEESDEEWEEVVQEWKELKQYLAQSIENWKQEDREEMERQNDNNMYSFFSDFRKQIEEPEADPEPEVEGTVLHT